MQDLAEKKEKQLKDLSQLEIERLKELIELNAATIQEYYDFKLKVTYLQNGYFKSI